MDYFYIVDSKAKIPLIINPIYIINQNYWGFTINN